MTGPRRICLHGFFFSGNRRAFGRIARGGRGCGIDIYAPSQVGTGSWASGW